MILVLRAVKKEIIMLSIALMKFQQSMRIKKTTIKHDPKAEIVNCLSSRALDKEQYNPSPQVDVELVRKCQGKTMR